MTSFSLHSHIDIIVWENMVITAWNKALCCIHLFRQWGQDISVVMPVASWSTAQNFIHYVSGMLMKRIPCQGHRNVAKWVPVGSPLRGGDVMVYVWHKPTELAHSFKLCSLVYFCLYGPFNCISFHKFSQQLSVFSLCSCGLISTPLVLSTIYLFMKVSFSPDIIPSGWLAQNTN